MSSAFVCFLGVGTVFIGLICIIVLCWIMGLICQRFVNEEPVAARSAVSAPAPVQQPAKVENKQEIIAAVTCAIAEELGTDVKGIRVKSFRKL